MVWFGEGVEHRRCLFHKPRTMQRAVTGDKGMTRAERQQRRRAVLADAVAV